MQKLIYYILFLVLISSFSCNDDVRSGLIVEDKATIKLMQGGFETRIIDQDNLESEQTQINITILFTEPGSDVITHKYVNVGFQTVDDYKLVTLPIALSELGRKDIYVVTNYGNASFNAVSTLQDLEAKTTPAVNKNNNLNPANGLCMFGKTLDFDFNNETHSPAIVYAVRTCAKYRVTLTFPQNPTLSTNNSFLITGAASYTYIISSTGNSIPSNAYFDFASPITLQANEVNKYVNVAYVYEATQAPKIHVYTHINDSPAAQEYSADLPVPVRNYLYDINVQIYEDSSNALLRNYDNNDKRYKYEMSVTVFDEQGQKLEYP